MNIITTETRAKEFQQAHDSNYNVVYYLACATPNGTGDEALKLIMGPILAELNSRQISIKDIESVLPAKFLHEFVRGLVDGVFERSQKKPILSALFDVDINKFDPLYKDKLYELFTESKFNVIDSTEVESIVRKLITENKKQAQKARENTKLIQWFVGQVMKQTSGKVNPKDAYNLIESIIKE